MGWRRRRCGIRSYCGEGPPCSSGVRCVEGAREDDGHRDHSLDDIPSVYIRQAYRKSSHRGGKGHSSSATRPQRYCDMCISSFRLRWSRDSHVIAKKADGAGHDCATLLALSVCRTDWSSALQTVGEFMAPNVCSPSWPSRSHVIDHIVLPKGDDGCRARWWLVGEGANLKGGHPFRFGQTQSRPASFEQLPLRCVR